MVSVRQWSADFFVRYAIVDADRQGVTGPLERVDLSTWQVKEDANSPGKFKLLDNHD